MRRLRLEALADAPRDFDSTLERERVMTTAEWGEWIAGGATFILEAGSAPRGIVAGVPHRDDPRAVYLISMWVHPSIRGSGAADALVGAVIGWAEEREAEVVCLDVVASNDRARGCYERNGFRATGRTFTRGRDGIVEMAMELRLDPGS